ncbi:MAG: hypothetical protein A3H28_10695 [Acidobacteria bacterium RIFCSPLOWO2_02_FULL_61_28]|nr:MAG: hypothetical protein A3H28_10695 [Acidobacteria bacterium RIFCSPLOWO2_02_FULL_61_28]
MSSADVRAFVFRAVCKSASFWKEGSEMNGFCNRVLIGGVLAVVWQCQIAGAQGVPNRTEPQEQIDPKTTTRVTLGGTSGTPGTSVVVPIYFTPAENLQVGRIKLEVHYVSVNMKFSKLDTGIAAELGGVDVHAEVQEGKNERGVETQTVTVTASFLSPAPPQKGIPAGLLAYMTLRLTDTARTASIGLRPTAEASDLGGNKPVQNLRAFETKVDVLAPGTQPLLACFFFTH